MRLTSFTIGMLTLLACSDSTSPDHELQGSWVESQGLQPRGNMNRTLTFKEGNEFAFRVDVYGAYDGGSSLSSFTEITGEYKLHDNGALEFHATHQKSWDAVYFGRTTQKSEVSYSMFDECTFSISGSILTLSYITYPADAPVPTVMHLKRK